MKKIIILALIGYGIWNYISENTGSIHSSPPVAVYEPQKNTSFQQTQSNFRCDGRQHCSQMSSKAEALFFLRNCPDTKMDGDNDGDPCERQFSRY